MSNRQLWVLCIALGIKACGLAQDPTQVISVPNPPNTAAAQAKHYVVMVSVDGFRYDYPKKYGAPHLLALGAEGASAPDGMLPSYPSLTFPNHLSLITGLYPEHHGIVANTFYDPARDATYVYKQSKSNGDGSWYSGTPLWVLAEQQGMRAACLFWPGSEAEIAGKRPSYYLKFDDKLDDRKRIDQVIAWLQLPPEQRPHFITLYFSNVDHAGHEYGPESDETRAAVHHLDDMIGELHTKLDALKLPLDLVVVADHGMATLKPDAVNLSDFADLGNFHTEGSLLYAKTDADAAKAYDQFKAHPDPRFSVYRRADVPAALHYDANPREGDPVIIPNGPYLITAHASLRPETERGGHGFDPRQVPEMKAIFFAAGYDIWENTKFEPFENVNVYPWVAGILDLKPPPNDGTLKILMPALQNPEHPAKSGGPVKAPVLIHSQPPKLSEEARKQGLSGQVVVKCVVGADGFPKHLRILKSLSNSLDESALDTVKDYKFRPAIQDGLPVVVELNVVVNYHLSAR